jgi:protein containing DUF559
MDNNRCERIAELLLKENEINKIERVSTLFNCQDITACFDYYDANEVPLTPIEKIMYAILTRVVDCFNESYDSEIQINFSPQEKIGCYRVDFVVEASFSDDKVIIECDGHDFHEKTKQQAKHDKERDRYLISLGYKVLRYTGSEIYNDFDKIEKELSKLLDIPLGKSLFSERKEK